MLETFDAYGAHLFHEANVEKVLAVDGVQFSHEEEGLVKWQSVFCYGAVVVNGIDGQHGFRGGHHGDWRYALGACVSGWILCIFGLNDVGVSVAVENLLVYCV